MKLNIKTDATLEYYSRTFGGCGRGGDGGRGGNSVGGGGGGDDDDDDDSIDGDTCRMM